MKKIAWTNIIFGIISCIYFYLFWQLTLEYHWMPNENNRAILLSVALAFFIIVTMIYSVYSVIYGVLVMIIMKKRIPSVLMGIDCMVKGGFVFVSLIFTIIFVAWGFVGAYVSNLVYIAIILTLAIINILSQKKLMG